MAKTPALLFDLDGTLVDSLDDIVVALNDTMGQYGFAPLCRDVVSRFIGKGSRVLVEKALRETLSQLPESGFVDVFVEKYLQNMLQTQGQWTRCFEGVIDSLETLRAHGFELALVTNKPRANTCLLLSQLKLESLFSIIVAGDDTPHPKPAPDMLLLAAQLLHKHPDDCIMIGDSMNDALAAQNARIACYLVQTGYNEGINIGDWAKIHAPEALLFANIRAIASHLLP